MPTISTFFGIIIRIFYSDHNPPHFHAEYGEYEIQITIETLETLQGKMPKRAHAMILEWANLHREELKKDWELARHHKPLDKIEPLL